MFREITANRLMLKVYCFREVIMNKTENFHKVRIGQT